MGFSHDSHPFVGNSPDEPQKWVIGGFHGHGIVRIFLSAKAVAQNLLSQDAGRPLDWPEWMPHGYINTPTRSPAVGEVKDYLTHNLHS